MSSFFLLLNRIWRRRYQLQKFYFRAMGIKIGRKNTFNDWIKIVILKPNVVIGDNNVFNEGVILNNRENITIGCDNHFSSGTKIITSKWQNGDHISSPVFIGDSIIVGTNTVILSGHKSVSICSNVEIGIGSLVIRDIEVSGIYLGSPARQIS